MNHDIVPHKTPRALARQGLRLPAIIDDAGEHAQRKFIEFFVARIRNKNTRAAYGRAVMQFFDWCDERGLALHDIEPIAVAAYIEAHPGSAPTVKQHLAAIRMLEKLGFQREGHLRERWLVNDEKQDALLYGLLQREWRDAARSS